MGQFAGGTDLARNVWSRSHHHPEHSERGIQSRYEISQHCSHEHCINACACVPENRHTCTIGLAIVLLLSGPLAIVSNVMGWGCRLTDKQKLSHDNF